MEGGLRGPREVAGRIGHAQAAGRPKWVGIMVCAGLEPVGGSRVGLKGRMGPRVGPWKPVRHCPPLFHWGSKLFPVGQGPVFGHTAGRRGGQGAVGAKPGIGSAAVTAQVQGWASP